MRRLTVGGAAAIGVALWIVLIAVFIIGMFTGRATAHHLNSRPADAKLAKLYPGLVKPGFSWGTLRARWDDEHPGARRTHRAKRITALVAKANAGGYGSRQTRRANQTLARLVLGSEAGCAATIINGESQTWDHRIAYGFRYGTGLIYSGLAYGLGQARPRREDAPLRLRRGEQPGHAAPLVPRLRAGALREHLRRGGPLDAEPIMVSRAALGLVIASAAWFVILTAFLLGFGLGSAIGAPGVQTRADQTTAWLKDVLHHPIERRAVTRPAHACHVRRADRPEPARDHLRRATSSIGCHGRHEARVNAPRHGGARLPRRRPARPDPVHPTATRDLRARRPRTAPSGPRGAPSMSARFSPP